MSHPATSWTAPRTAPLLPSGYTPHALSVAHQAARAQALLDRIADVSEAATGSSGESATVASVLEALDAREALLSDLAPVVAELSAVRGRITAQSLPAAQARAFDLALAPVEQAARRALSFHEQLLQKMQAMREELVWEMDRLDQLGTMAQGYLHDSQPAAAVRLDVRR